MPTLDAFLTDVRACTRCAPHLPHGVQPVLGFGEQWNQKPT